MRAKKPVKLSQREQEVFNAGAASVPMSYATAIAIVYDSICCCACSCPEHQSGKIRSEVRFEKLPPGLSGWRTPGAFPLDRERGTGPMKASAVRSRAAAFAALFGLPLLDEALGAIK